MPIIAPDRIKNRIAGMAMARLLPGAGSIDTAKFSPSESGQERTSAESKEAGAMALRAMFSAMQDGDFTAAYSAYYQLHSICDSQMDAEGEDE
jgi:hypothetical protein